MVETPSSSVEVLPVAHMCEVFNGKWFGFLVTSPRGTPIWVSLPAELMGKGKKYFYDPEKKTLSLPAGSGYDAKDIEFVMGLKSLTVFKPKV